MARVPQMVQEVARIVTGSDDLPGFLRNHFVGLLNSIDRKMLRVEDFMLQKQALKCIGKLIEMIGTHLGTYVPKIIVLLMHAVEKESLQNESLEVWHFFITQLSKVSPSSLKHVASQVFAALIPWLERYKENPSLHLDKVVNIFEELVVENKILLAHNIRELPLLPSIPMLGKVNKVIEEARGSMSLRDHLRHAVDGLNHESLNVRAASDTIVQDSAALAIQELLKLAGCQASLDGSDLSSTSQHSKAEACQGITEEILSVLNAAASESSGAAVHGIAGGQREQDDNTGSSGGGDHGGSGGAEKRKNDSRRNTPVAAVLDGGSAGNSDGGSVAGRNTPATAVLDGAEDLYSGGVGKPYGGAERELGRWRRRNSNGSGNGKRWQKEGRRRQSRATSQV
ncbi:Serine/threonine-protein kinase [Nymphaea thermarum]|nr:Serine/threonine-protein kinase [Nymphaea thermarum]